MFTIPKALSARRWIPVGPLRPVACGRLLTAVGDGAWYTSWAIFLTRSVGLAPAEVGIGMTLAGVVGLLLATPFGHLADRAGAREVLIAMLVLQAVATLAYVEVHSFALFLPVACVTVALDHSSGGVANALVIGLTKGTDSTHAMSLLRSLGHLGWAAGAVFGAVVIGLNSRQAYVTLVVVNAASFLCYARLLMRVPQLDRMPKPSQGARLTVMHDRPYMTLAALMGVLALCWGMLSSGVPLWIVFHTHAPRSMAAIIVLINSLAIAAFQVRFTNRITSPLRAARGAIWSGAALAVSCLLFALTNNEGGIGAVALLLTAGALSVLGELLFVAASWGLSIPLMPEHSPGQYQGMFATGEATALMIAPALMTLLVVTWGQPGWLALAAIFLINPVLAKPATRWALSTRAALAPSLGAHR
jgi:MFS family permease